MESRKFDQQSGQILVQVAIMAVVLLAFVALAVDAGQVYGGRRRMQNAADAGALAGAQEICFGGHAAPGEWEPAAIEEAKEYAMRNGAEADPEVRVAGHVVIVTATQTLDTFFAGVIGIDDANVRGEAAASCGGSVSAGGLWPLAFKWEIYVNDIECGGDFFVFASQSSSDDDDNDYVCAPYDHDYCENEIDSDDPYYNSLDCDAQAVGAHISTQDRGWLLFPEPEGPYPFPEECKANKAEGGTCGEPMVACWLAEEYPGGIEIGDCIAGKSGVQGSADVVSAVDSTDFTQIILWDGECEETLGACSGTPYNVAEFGCIQVIGFDRSEPIPTCGGSPGHRNLDLIRVTKICDKDDYKDEYEEFCSSSTGSTTGVPPEEWETRSVSLIQWPRPAEE